MFCRSLNTIGIFNWKNNLFEKLIKDYLVNIFLLKLNHVQNRLALSVLKLIKNSNVSFSLV